LLLVDLQPTLHIVQTVFSHHLNQDISNQSISIQPPYYSIVPGWVEQLSIASPSFSITIRSPPISDAIPRGRCLDVLDTILNPSLSHGIVLKWCLLGEVLPLLLLRSYMTCLRPSRSLIPLRSSRLLTHPPYLRPSHNTADILGPKEVNSVAKTIELKTADNVDLKNKNIRIIKKARETIRDSELVNGHCLQQPVRRNAIGPSTGSRLSARM
jgi:hypothetical protein